jgi:hypothetical protein
LDPDPESDAAVLDASTAINAPTSISDLVRLGCFSFVAIVKLNAIRSAN